MYILQMPHIYQEVTSTNFTASFSSFARAFAFLSLYCAVFLPIWAQATSTPTFYSVWLFGNGLVYWMCQTIFGLSMDVFVPNSMDQL